MKAVVERAAFNMPALPGSATVNTPGPPATSEDIQGGPIREPESFVTLCVSP